MSRDSDQNRKSYQGQRTFSVEISQRTQSQDVTEAAVRSERARKRAHEARMKKQRVNRKRVRRTVRPSKKSTHVHPIDITEPETDPEEIILPLKPNTDTDTIKPQTKN